MGVVDKIRYLARGERILS